MPGTESPSSSGLIQLGSEPGVLEAAEAALRTGTATDQQRALIAFHYPWRGHPDEVVTGDATVSSHGTVTVKARGMTLDELRRNAAEHEAWRAERRARRVSVRRGVHLRQAAARKAPSGATPRTGRAQREATNARTRGSRRSSASASGSRGSPDDLADPEPSSRRCACGCGADLSGRRPQTVYATDTCRKRSERATQARVDRDHAAHLLARLAASTTARDALEAFVGLSVDEREIVVEALGLDGDADDRRRLVFTPVTRADMAVAA